MAHLIVNHTDDIEALLQLWEKQGYCRAHYMSNKIAIYIPWCNVIYAQYADSPENPGDVAHAGE